MAKVTYRGVSYDTQAAKATTKLVVESSYRGVRTSKVVEVIK